MIFSGHRIYNGCPDSKMRDRLDKEDNQMKRIKAFEPEAHATYFPLEGQYMIHVYGRPLSGMHYSRGDALDEVLTNSAKE